MLIKISAIVFCDPSAQLLNPFLKFNEYFNKNNFYEAKGKVNQHLLQEASLLRVNQN